MEAINPTAAYHPIKPGMSETGGLIDNILT